MPPSENSFKFIVYIAVLIGVAYHLLLCFRPDGLITDRPFRDDSFYVFTIASNVADGKGFTSANGEIFTNGFQPLFVLISTIPYFITSDKFIALRIIHFLHLILHLISAFILYKFIGLFTKKQTAKLTGVALWMSSYYMLDKTSNGLETSLYLLMILLCSLMYIKYTLNGYSLNKYILFGFIMGLTTLTRIDGVFLFLAIAIHYTYFYRNSLKNTDIIKRLSIWFIPWLIITAPWWIYNISLTGSIIPSSGQVQTIKYLTGSSFSIDISAENLLNSINIIGDQIILVLVTPIRIMQMHAYYPFLWFAVRFLIIILLFYFFRKKFSQHKQENENTGFRTVFFYPLYLLFLVVYYNFFFGVPWYLNRYLAPCVILFIIISSLAITRYNLIFAKIWIILVISGSVITAAFTLNKYYDVMYIEQVKWVKDNLNDSVWVAGMQSGTLGYFHDKTLNADGKVNIEILNVPRSNLGGYLAAKKINYIIEEKEYMKNFQNDNLFKYYQLFDETEHFAVYKRK